MKLLQIFTHYPQSSIITGILQNKIITKYYKNIIPDKDQIYFFDLHIYYTFTPICNIIITRFKRERHWENIILSQSAELE